MDLHFLKALVLVTCLLLIQPSILAQKNKLKMHAISIGPGIASSTSATADSGVGLNFDISTRLNKHIFSFNFSTGLDLNAGGPDEDFHEFNLTYGRKWNLAQNLWLEGHIGIGLFAYDIDDGGLPLFIDSPESTIGFPIRAKLIFYPYKNVGIGLNPNLNMNSIENAYAANFIFQLNFD